jgi:hypothetical protein
VRKKNSFCVDAAQLVIWLDIKVAQELLRLLNSRTTLDIYTRAVSRQKQAASVKIIELLLLEKKVS